jgi:isopentenyl-diphosphate delta-isomerase
MTRPLPTASRISSRDDLESVTLVDTEDNAIGSCDKITAHREGNLHRAFSILIASCDGELLLQQRAAHKYHFANRWSNACCGHPRPGESTPDAAHRRLVEELGFSVPLTQVTAFSYCAKDEISGLVEHEYLHIFQGLYAGELTPNPDEVGAYRWMQPDRVRRGIASRPDLFTPWFVLMTARAR